MHYRRERTEDDKATQMGTVSLSSVDGTIVIGIAASFVFALANTVARIYSAALSLRPSPFQIRSFAER